MTWGTAVRPNENVIQLVQYPKPVALKCPSYMCILENEHHPFFVGWLLFEGPTAPAPRICFKFLSELSSVENSSAVTSSLTLNMTMWWAPASAKDGEFTTKTWKNDSMTKNSLRIPWFEEIATSSGCSSPIWVRRLIQGMHWNIQWKVVQWSLAFSSLVRRHHPPIQPSIMGKGSAYLKMSNIWRWNCPSWVPRSHLYHQPKPKKTWWTCKKKHNIKKTSHPP